MISLDYLSSAVSRVLAQYDVSEAYLFGSFARGEQTPDSDIDLRLICGNTMTFARFTNSPMSSRGNLGERSTSLPTLQSTCARHPAKTSNGKRYAFMSQHKRNDEFTDATIQPYPPKEPNAESLQAIREGDAFFASDEAGRFDNSADLINAALNAPEV